MWWTKALVFGLFLGTTLGQSTEQGIYSLVKRRMPRHADKFEFSLVNATDAVAVNASKPLDHYVVSTSAHGKVLVEGNSLSALSSG